MRLKNLLITIVSIAVLQACSSSSNAPRAVDTSPATNPGGDVVTAVITANFDPSNGVVPFPTNLLLSGTTDLTLNAPAVDPADFGDPRVALNALDGFSTIAPWGTGFSVDVAPSSVTTGNSVRVFEVTLTGPGGGVTGITRELTPGVEYVAVPNGAGIGIVPLQALKQITSYMAVLTNGITDAAGNAATPAQTYFLAKRTSSLVDANGNSTDPLLDTATAQALEPLRQLTNSQEFAASSVGIDPADIVLSWVMTTQSITPVMSAVYAMSGPGASSLAFTGLNTSVPPINGAGIADIYIGIQSSPYYLEAPSAGNPTAPLNGFWKAAAGAYVAPFDQFGLDPTSTNLTFANPFPVATGVQTYPVIMTLPNANSGHTKPASGWPIVIFQHGITRSRLDMFAVAETLASIGYAVIAQDLALHGVTDNNNPFYVENTPFGPIANERTFDLDFAGAEGGGPDGIIDSSGSYTINLSNLLVSRDILRQGSADLFTLTATIPTMDYDADGTPDFDGSRIAFVSQSLGSITGTVFLAIEENVTTAVLSVGGGGIARLLDGSPAFGPSIRAGLEAAAGLISGTPEYDLFMIITQTVIDAGDPLNFAAITGARNNILFHEVIGDQVITNTVPGAPLSGTEPLIAALGLPSISSTTSNADGLDGAVRFTEGDHGSILSPEASLAATVEMQTQMASMVATVGTTVVVTDTSVVQQ